MAGRAYSTRFILRQGEVGFTSWYVPTGKRAVVKSLVAYSEAPASYYAQAFAAAARFWFWTVPGGAAATSLQTSLVLYADEALRVFTNHAEIDLVLSGYLFDDSEGPPAVTKPEEIVRPVPGPYVAGEGGAA